MNKGLSIVGGVGLGAGLMYLLDPNTGRRRRALLRDKATWVASRCDDAVGKTFRDVSNRTRGMVSEARSLVTRRPVSDDVLAERVRSKIGRAVSHPGAIEAAANQGRVTLSGPVLKAELDHLIRAVSGVRGVTEVENRLEPHETAGAGLQGGAGRREERFELMQTNWSPAARLCMGLTGTTLAILGMRQGPALGTPLGLLGLGLLARSVTNIETVRLFGLDGGRRVVDVHKTINVAAPVEEVFETWTNFKNFPRIFSHVRAVRDLGDGRTHWEIAGPNGISAAWDAEITQFVPNHILSWKSVPGAAVENAGTIQFEPNPDGTTRLQIRMSYSPPAGALGHALAALLGADPKRLLDQDLVRFKSLLEEGKTRAHGRPVLRQELAS